MSGKGKNPGRKHLLELAQEFSIHKPEEIITEVQEAIAEWPNIAKECGVNKTSISRIQATLLTLKD